MIKESINEIFQDGIKSRLSNLNDNEKMELVNNMIDVTKFWENEVKSKEDLSKHIKKIKNKEIESYERFKSWAFLEYFNYKAGLEKGFFSLNSGRASREMIQQSYIDNKIKKEQVFQLLCTTELNMMTAFFNKDGKKFNINNDLFSLLRNTKVNLEYVNPPYRNFFISCKGLVIDNVEIFGINVRQGVLDDGVEKCLDFVSMGIDLSDGELIWFADNIFQTDSKFKFDRAYTIEPSSPKINDYDSWCDDSTVKQIRLEIKKIVVNFLQLLNHPDVELINKSMKILRDARVKKGRLGIPDSVEINLTGKLKRYINDTNERNEKAWELGHRFWVRGHWMTFQHERYKNKIGQKVWVLPYIKGKGDMVNKDYYIGQKEQCWENEKRMIGIIRSMYPEHEILVHDRRTLDGLEIDCYIPSLKLGFEYDGLQHYEHVKIFHKTIEDFKAQQQRDIEKRKRANDKGIQIITIKYDESVTKEVIESKITQCHFKVEPKGLSTFNSMNIHEKNI